MHHGIVKLEAPGVIEARSTDGALVLAHNVMFVLHVPFQNIFLQKPELVSNLPFSNMTEHYVSNLSVGAPANVTRKSEFFVSLEVVKVEAADTLELLSAARNFARNSEGFARVILNAVSLEYGNNFEGKLKKTTI